MEFFGAPAPEIFTKFMGDIRWRIFGEGEIDLQSAYRLERFLVENKVPLASVLYLHSSGGSLDGGMSLGRVIRTHQLQVSIAQKGEWKPEGLWEALPGYCMSAAAVAFLGGEFRFVGEKNQYGVHQFTLQGDESNVGEAQVRSAIVIEYIRSMDVDTELFALAAETPADDILVLPEATLERLNVVNNGRKKPKWSIESIPGVLYLKGEQETQFGMSKFLMLFPAIGDMMLHVIFDAGVNADDVMRMPTDRLVVDGEYIPMRDYRHGRENDSTRINAIYRLDGQLVEKIAGAKTVGMCFQWSEDAPIFLGFESMPFEGGAAKLPGLLDVYRRGEPA